MILPSTGRLGRLGKRPPKIDSRTLQLRDYLPNAGEFSQSEKELNAGILAPPPPEISWVVKVPSWPMFLNDTLGDCTIAAAAHMIEQWCFYTRRPFTVTDQDVLTAYEAVSGYIPGDPNTDNGAVMLDVLNYWRAVGIGGHKILAFMAVDWTNADERRQCIELFGSMYVGLALPVSAQGETDWTVPAGGIYSSDGQPGSWGGHAVPVMAESPITDTVITWGQRLKMSHNFLGDYVDEAYAVLSADWVATIAPNRFNLAELEADLKQL